MPLTVIPLKAERQNGNFVLFDEIINVISKNKISLKNGDVIEIDAEKGSLKVQLSHKELNKRKKKWKPKRIEYNSGTLWKYSQSVGPAFKGAVTHPGASKEKKCYADI